jgi:hypothetical protein
LRFSAQNCRSGDPQGGLCRKGRGRHRIRREKMEKGNKERSSRRRRKQERDE